MNANTPVEKSLIVRYTAAILAALAAVLVHSAIAPYVGSHFVFGTFYLATCMSAWYGGIGPAIVTALLGLLAVERFFIFSSSVVETLSYCIISFTFAFFSNALVRSRAQAKHRQVELEREVSDRKRTEAALRQSEEMLKEAGKSKDAFLAQLSHELRTPLTPVLAAAQLIERSPEAPARITSLVSTIIRNVVLEARLIDDLLDMTRIAHGKIRLCISVFNIHTLIKECIETCRTQTEEKQQDLQLELNAELPVMRGDPARVSQIIWNLLSNSIKFTPARGSITIRTRNATPETIEISVLDTGAGIEASVIPGIFNAFEQAPREGQKQSGLGLGLAISKNLAELHQGSLKAKSDGKDKGAEFILTLPVLQLADVRIDRDTRTAARIENGLEILLVEDHADTALVMKSALEMEGSRVVVAHDVMTALDAGRKEHFDLLVSDIGLPDGSGIDIIKALSVRNKLKGIALTGFGMEDDVRRCLEAGFAAHLTKPVDLNALQEMIRKIVT